MKKGDIVTIYAQPLTHERPEGDARLIKRLKVDGGIKDYSYWDVEFLNEPGIVYQRWAWPS